MNLITDTWRGLVRRKLWPVALLLVGALVAVPLTLAKTPEVEPAPANVAAAVADEGMVASYVTSATDEEATEEESGKRRRTLGDSKDPFEPAPLPKKKKAKKKASTSSAPEEETTSKEPAPSSGGGASAPTTSAPVATATPTATPKPAPLNSIRVRFSKVTDEESETPKSQLVERLEVLPDEENPVLVYRGVEDGGKIAVFELTGTVTVEGDGKCEPTPENCQYLRLRAGETEFVTVTDTGEETDAQYQIDLVKINRKR
jgi:hypothetical protein